MGFGEMTLDAPPVAFGQFMLCDGSQKAGGGPAFFVGLLGKLRPYDFDGWQTQFVEEQAELGGVNAMIRLHAASPVAVMLSKASYVLREASSTTTVGSWVGSGAKRSCKAGISGKRRACSDRSS